MKFFKSSDPFLKYTQNLHNAAQLSRAEDMRQWIAKGGSATEILIAKDYNGNALHAFAAVRHNDFTDGDARVLRVLVEHGVDVNSENADGRTPMHVAAMVHRKYRGSALILQAMVNRGGDINRADRNGRTPLHILCDDAETRPDVLLECVETLLDNNARVDAVDRNGLTPLMLAAFNGREDIYALLRRKGANIHYRDNKGRRASDHAVANGHYHYGQMLAQQESDTPETRPSFDSTVVPKTEWHLLAEDRIARVTVEDPIKYKLTEIFNFRTRTYTCITQNLYTKAEAVTARTFAEFGDAELIALAQLALSRKNGTFTAGKSANPLRPRTSLKITGKKD